jgi:hypothetical protein
MNEAIINIIDLSRKHFLNIPGKRLKKKYIIFESDDWGSERMPSRESLNYLKLSGADVYRNPFNYLDSLETDDDLSALYEILLGVKDIYGNHPVITANSVLANPDFERIKATGYSEYFYTSTIQTYTNKKGCKNSHALIREGMDAGIYHPQFHGREHLNVTQWMNSLKQGNELLLKAFDAGISGIDLDSESMKRSNFTAAFDSNSELESATHEDIISEGITLFKEAFNYIPGSFIAPCYVWHPSLEIPLKKGGVKFIQGLPVQYVPYKGGNYKKIYHFQGEHNRNHQVYFIRNCFFEPALNREFNWIQDCLRRLEIIFFWNKPAILGTHRINFIGSLDEENRKCNLKDFSILLKLILKTWPDVEFTTTDRLGELY